MFMSCALKCSLFLDFPLPGVVHSDVTSWTLQQFLLCLSPFGHRNGCQDPAYNSVLRHTQWKTGTVSTTKLKSVLEMSTDALVDSAGLFLADDDCGFAGCGCVPLYCGGLQLLQEVLQ